MSPTVLVIKTQKKSENGEIYTPGKKFTLPPAWTNLTFELDGEVGGTKCGRGFVIVLVWVMANSHTGGAFVSASS